MLTKKNIKKSLSLFILATIFSCAHQMPPTGGLEDKKSPDVALTVPAVGAVNVPKNSSLTITFAEWIAPNSVRRAITIFPSVPKGFKYEVSRKKLIITPSSPLADSTTYHIGINSTLQDLHGNSFGKPFQLIFSTGPFLDSARLFGCVIDAKMRILQPKVALFKVPQKSSLDSLFTIPDYLTQTDSFGVYSFDNIRKGTYRTIAFLDGNSDGKLQTAEQTFASTNKYDQANLNPDTVRLYPVSADTSNPQVVTLEGISSTIVRGSWNKTPDTISGVDKAPHWQITQYDTLSAKPLDFTYLQLGNSNNFVLRFNNPLNKGQYRVIYSLDRMKDSTTIHFTDTIRFTSTVEVDTQKASLQFTSPSNNATTNLRPTISFVWRKPVRLTFTKLYARDTLGDSTLFVVQKGFSDTTVLCPQSRLIPGQKYWVQFGLWDVEDLYGKRLSKDTSDSFTVSIRFTTISPDSLSYLLSGGAPCMGVNPLRKWMFVPLSKSDFYLSNDSSGNFHFDSIPASRGTVRYFVDQNRDNYPNPGSLAPWRAPEPYVALYDTLEARARWELEGVQVPACDACGTRSSQKQKPAAPVKK